MDPRCAKCVGSEGVRHKVKIFSFQSFDIDSYMNVSMSMFFLEPRFNTPRSYVFFYPQRGIFDAIL